jgi:hypothetical protein
MGATETFWKEWKNNMLKWYEKIGEKMGVTETFWKEWKNNMLKWYEKIGEKIGVTETFWKEWKNNMLQWYEHIVRMEDNRWPKRIMTWSPGGERQRGRPEVQWEKKVERLMKQNNLTSDDAINLQLWRKVNGEQQRVDRWRTGYIASKSFDLYSTKH